MIIFLGVRRKQPGRVSKPPENLTRSRGGAEAIVAVSFSLALTLEGKRKRVFDDVYFPHDGFKTLAF